MIRRHKRIKMLTSLSRMREIRMYGLKGRIRTPGLGSYRRLNFTLPSASFRWHRFWSQNGRNLTTIWDPDFCLKIGPKAGSRPLRTSQPGCCGLTHYTTPSRLHREGESNRNGTNACAAARGLSRARSAPPSRRVGKAGRSVPPPRKAGSGPLAPDCAPRRAPPVARAPRAPPPS